MMVRMCRLRQLIFTRLIQCLSQPFFRSSLGGPTNADEKRSLDSERELAHLLLESLALSGEYLHSITAG